MKISPPSSIPFRMRPLWADIVAYLSQRDPGLNPHHLPMIESYVMQAWLIRRQAMALRKMPELADDPAFSQAMTRAANTLKSLAVPLGLDWRALKGRPVGQPPNPKHEAPPMDGPSVADILASLHDSPGPRDTLQ